MANMRHGKTTPFGFDPRPLVAALRLKGWSQARLAAVVNKSPMTISFIFSGQFAYAPTVAAVCDALGVPRKAVWPEAEKPVGRKRNRKAGPSPAARCP